MIVGAAINDRRLAGDDGSVRSREEGNGADDVGGDDVALERAVANGKDFCEHRR